MLERAFPEPLITGHDFYRRLIGWVIDNRTPILYEQDHESEYANFSIGANWLLRRDYKDTDEFGPATTRLGMYSLHEYTHMTHPLPTRLDELSDGQCAELFTHSEYRASNETEIMIHYRVPELRSLVLPGTKIVFDIMKARDIEQPDAASLVNLRAAVIESNYLDHVLGTDPGDMAVLAGLKRFSGNRDWARKHYAAWRPHMLDPVLPLGYGLTHAEYEPTISAYEPGLTQEQYEHNIIRNVRLGYAMCGLAIPSIATFTEAREAAVSLEGHHAVIHTES